MARSTRPKAVLFDLYNTLIDIRTEEDAPEVWENLARILRYDGVIADPEALHDAFRDGIRRMLRESAEPHPEVDLRAIFGAALRDLGYTGPEQLALRVTQQFRALSMRRFRLFPDVRPVLELLRPRARLGLISDAQRAFLEPETELLGIAPFFDVRIVSYDYGFRKPDARLFRMALAALDVAPEQAIYVGDHPYRDICGARQVGLRAVLIRRAEVATVDPRACEPDAVIAGLEELAALVLA